ncbi:MAG TPA: response regulator transcription factor [Acidobacteriota bacterium]|nr:response regulator transcription factor [Acidobacteriota bacterium]
MQERSEFDVAGDAAPGEDALSLLSRVEADVVVIGLAGGADVLLPALNALLKTAPSAKAVLLADVRDDGLFEEAIMRGVQGIVLAGASPEELYNALSAVAEGRVWMDPGLYSRLLNRVRRRDPQPRDSDQAKMASLTRREREIVAVLSEGLTTKEVAERLFVSETTVRHHLTSIFSKLGVSNRMKLVLYALRRGLVSPLQE